MNKIDIEEQERRKNEHMSIKNNQQNLLIFLLGLIFQAIGCNRILFQYAYEQLNFKQHTERIAIDKLGSVDTRDTFLSDAIRSIQLRSLE